MFKIIHTQCYLKNCLTPSFLSPKEPFNFKNTESPEFRQTNSIRQPKRNQAQKKMDIRAEFEKVLKGMEWDEVVSTLIELFGSDDTVPTSPPSPPLPTPTEPEQTDLPQLVYTVLDKPMVVAPPFFVESLPCASEVCEAQEAPAQKQEPSDGQHSIILCDMYNPDNSYNEGQVKDSYPNNFSTEGFNYAFNLVIACYEH